MQKELNKESHTSSFYIKCIKCIFNLVGILLELPSGKELMSTHLFRSGHGAVFWLIIVNANIYV